MKAFFGFVIRWIVPILGLIALALIIWFVGPLLDVPNTSTPGGLSAPRVLLLIGVVALLHAGAWWVFQQAKAEPVITPPEIPEMTVELTSPAPPAPPVEEPPPPPPPPEPEELPIPKLAEAPKPKISVPKPVMPPFK